MTKPNPTPPRVCPTCGTRVGDLATKCIVCGADLGGPAASTQPIRVRRSILPQRPSFLQPTRIPPSQTPSQPSAAAHPTPVPTEHPVPTRGAISLPLPVALGIILVFVLMSVILIFGALGMIPLGNFLATSTPVATVRPSAPPTFTPAPTATETPAPSPTPLPPITYTVVQGDSCISIAFKNNVSVQTILEANGLSQACPIFVGQKLTLPQPTYTPTAPASNTPVAEALTQTALPRTSYTVAAGDTLLSIAARFNVDVKVLAKENGLPESGQGLRTGQKISIPLFAPRATTGPTPTATSLPPYPAPSLLNPPNGAAISAAEQNVILQWAAVDVLKQGEAYMVTLEDVTCNCAKRKQEVTTTTRFIVNVDMKPVETNPHVFKWSVVTVRRQGTTTKGDPIYAPAGATSEERTFSWTGIGVAAPAPTKAP